jgi:hypothetical protein
MVVKYYGFGGCEWEGVGDERRIVPVNAVINVLFCTPAHELAHRCPDETPSASVWLVPGTFDLEGRHVG